MFNNTASVSTSTELQLYSVFYTFPKPENGAADLVQRINSATAELARYGLSGHVLWFRRGGHGFAVISRERDFLSRLPNPLHAAFSRGDVEACSEDNS
jgi:hypothetical protein